MRKVREWGAVAAAGIAAGGFINACEWLAHGWWLDAAWNDAFAALGRKTTGWAVFVPANFVVGVLAVVAYRWAEHHYGRGVRTNVGAAAGIWMVFWVVPIGALVPLDVFPDRLLAAVIAVGVVDGFGGTLLGAWLFRRLRAAA